MTDTKFYVSPPRSDVLQVMFTDTFADGDTALVCRRADYQRHFRGGHSVMYAAYEPCELVPCNEDGEPNV